MTWAELVVDIQRTAPRAHDGVSAPFRRGFEHGLRTSCRQALEELLERGRQPIVKLVARTPQCISSGGRGFLHPEEREVGWAGFVETCPYVWERFKVS